MEKTKRIITLFLAIVCALALCVTAGAADTSVITDMKTDCVVDAAGSCQITQTVTIDIAGTEDTIELPLAAGAKRISVAGYKYKKTTQDGYTVLVLSSNGGFAGSRTFTISYTVSGLVSEQDKIQTLTLPLLAPKWNWAINNYDFTITLPAAFEGYPTFTSGYYGDVIEDYMNFTVREGMIGGTISTALKDHESLTMTLDVGEGYFAGRYASWSSGWVETALVIVFSVLALLYWALTLRSKPLRASSRTAPPDAAAPSDLPYLLAGGAPDFNMLICHWAALGYLTIEMDEKGHVLLHRQVIMGNERKRLEYKIFSALFARGEICDGASLPYKKTAQQAMRAIERYWDKRLYARTSGNPRIMKALCALAMGVASLATMSQILPTMPARGLVLALCLIILQTPPAAWAILLVVGILALLLLTQLLRARQAGEGNRLALLLAAPLALLIGLIAALFPSDTYDRAEWSDHLQETISTAADRLTLFRRDAQTGQVKFTSPISPSTLGSYLWDSSVTGVNLNRVGPQRQFGRSVMRVKATLGSSWAGASFYLRGDSMAVYEDNRWKPLPENAYPDMKNMHNPLLAGEAVVSFQPEVTIETDMKSGIYYIPYNATAFPEDAEPFYDAYVKNPSQQTNYTVPFVLSRSPLQNSAYDAFVHETYTQVPDETRQALSDILSELVGEEDADPYQYIPRVLEYVSTSARYDLNTPAVPDGEDFVSWFLHDSETGYCVHYATAATILLRCLGVPARYVTGYYTDVYENEWTTVTSDDAHAWVEIYLNGIGWLRDDPTPAADTPAQTAPEEPIAAPIEPADNQPEDTPPAGDEPPAVPDIPAESQETPQKTDKKSVNILHFVWPVLVLAAALFLWRALRFSVRRTAIRRGSPNRRAVALYHHICWLSRQTKTEVPSDFLEIAEKARFSHHKLNREDLLPMQALAEQLTKQLLADKRFWKQVLYRVIYALG